jgi:hypothetical protein
LLVALCLVGTTGVNQFARPAFGQCQCCENGYNRAHRKDSSHISLPFAEFEIVEGALARALQSGFQFLNAGGLAARKVGNRSLDWKETPTGE